MKLSEAIREGAKIRPQGFGSLRQSVYRLFRKSEERTCALGAAFEAVNAPTITKIMPAGFTRTPFRGQPITLEQDTRLSFVMHPDEWDSVYYYPTYCPQCEKADNISNLVVHLNDDHKWKREEIALWVARQEGVIELEQAQESQAHEQAEWPSEIEVKEAAL